MIFFRGLWLLFFGLVLGSAASGQAVATKPYRTLEDADSVYVLGFRRKADVRAHFTSQRYLLEYGSSQGSGKSTGRFTNVSEFLGGGFTYKFLDLDLSFSLPQTRILETGIQNLTQFRLTGSFSSRRWVFRGYWLQSTGLVATDADGQFVSGPSVDMLSLGIPITYIFNDRRYSFRSAAFQGEAQVKSAGSFLLRVEPFFRRLGTGNVFVPPGQDIPAKYGEQAGLKYVYAPGIILLPGYGYNAVSANGRWFVSPMAFVGGGAAWNVYKGNSGEKQKLSPQWKASALLNMGYNGPRWYVAVRSTWEYDYFFLDPSFFRTTDIKLGFTIGYRFTYFEKWLPESLF